MTANSLAHIFSELPQQLLEADAIVTSHFTDTETEVASETAPSDSGLIVASARVVPSLPVG